MRIRNAERGASAVEFAIVASLLFMILFGIAQFGIAFNRYQGLQAGAREGARLASLPATTIDQIRDRVRDSVSIIDGSNLADACPASLAVEEGCIEVTPTGAGTFQPCVNRAGQTVRVDVRYRMQVSIPLWGNPALTVTGTGDFRCE